MGLITFINVAIGVSLGGLLYTIWPEHYFSWYPSIPFFYWVMAMAMTFFLDRVKRCCSRCQHAECAEVRDLRGTIRCVSSRSLSSSYGCTRRLSGNN